ncbi:mechanosensitive ion channel [Terrimonas sp. NA20]|uniref:Mechanosensitive ion channel n=1 Tax=Terrimonas ginsenosidimutans TaxID=2908004 RepID=A0ABS9KMK0_9BACT|nr:mechanosensitive ion channel domain-containing protein [Terrimonas ginsenosidimutans]MCG2613546.1 mechanosensitive ion channel [Terrimonas ginsenosidimutans]
MSYFQQPMNSTNRLMHKFLLTLIAALTVLSHQLIAQQPAATDSVHSDTTAPPSRINQIATIMRNGAISSRQEFEDEKKKLKQKHLLEALEASTIKAKNYLKHQLDTADIREGLLSVERWLELSVNDVIGYQSYISYRDLVTTGKLLNELDQRISGIKQRLDLYEKALVNFRFIADSLSADSAIYYLPADSAGTMEFLQQYSFVAARLQPADSMVSKALSGIHALQGKANLLQYKVSADLEEIDAMQRQTSKTLFLASSGPEDLQTIRGSLGRSKDKTLLLLGFYLEHHAGKAIAILLLIAASTIFLVSLKKIAKSRNLLDADHKGQIVLRYPFLSAVVLVFSLFQFLFPEPPFVINLACWLFSAFALAGIFRGFVVHFWFRFWLITVALFTCAGICNLSLQYSAFENWLILALAFAGVLTGSYYFFSRRRKELKEKLILTFIGLQMVIEIASIATNLSGYFNLSKAFFVCGYCNILIGVLFLWTVRFINEGLQLASEVYTKQSPKLFFVNFNKVGSRAPLLLYILLVAAWLILLGRNFYEYQYIAAPLKEFFIKERTVGDYTFAISNILIFFAIMLLAVLTSRITSFFASEKHTSHSAGTRKAGLGSWLLLVRVIIISSGLFLALAASGFPIDRITILIGALGVGIGLGLQSLVNNLVSGLIIAFDRPVNVGDFVEIGAHAGVVKAIGFRSSVLSSGTGADIVIPNGDLLNAHLVNWTLGGNRKQIELRLNIAYGSDLTRIKTLILDLIRADERILEYPGPAILFEQFGASSIEGKILCWARDYREAGSSKSDLLQAISTAFEKNGIKIPFPQQDIFLHQDKKDDAAEKDQL